MELLPCRNPTLLADLVEAFMCATFSAVALLGVRLSAARLGLPRQPLMRESPA
jgi:hypothetical protein